MDSASDSGSEGWGFESLLLRMIEKVLKLKGFKALFVFLEKRKMALEIQKNRTENRTTSEKLLMHRI